MDVCSKVDVDITQRRVKVNAKLLTGLFLLLWPHLCFCRLTAALSHRDFTDKANSHLSSALAI